MNTKLIDIMNGAKAMSKLAALKLTNFKEIYAIAMLKKNFDEKIKYYVEQEQKIIDEYAAKDEKGVNKISADGMVSFTDATNRNRFNSEITKLGETDVADADSSYFKGDPIRISWASFKPDQDLLTPSELASLCGFVEFVE